MSDAARCDAALDGRLPATRAHTVRFGRPLPLPLPLPRTVTFVTRRYGAAWAFAVRDPRSGAPHLTGSVT